MVELKHIMTRENLPAPFTEAIKDVHLRGPYIRSLNVDPESKNDKEFGVQWVFCSRHDNIHTTGWCSHLNVFKQPLASPYIGIAREEFLNLRKTWKEYGY
jgi:hypothetical protein